VTELISGIDLVKMQIKLAAGEKLNLDQDKIKICGNAIECRINAEDPDKDFLPSSGAISNYILPGGPGVRVDTGIYQGYTIPPFYDSMIAKLIVIGNNRQEAIARMERALGEFVIEGVKTTIPFHTKVMADEFYRKGEVNTGFIQERIFKQG